MNLPEQLRERFNYLGVTKDRAGVVALIEQTYPPESAEHKKIMLAHDVAQREHWHRRRHSGEREYQHLLRCFLVGWIEFGIRDIDDLCTMWLHDIAETFRTKWTFHRIAQMFGEEVAQRVRLMTKSIQLPGQTKRDVERHYYEVQLAGAPDNVVLLKGIDNFDNLVTLWKRSVKRVGRKIDDTIRLSLPLYRRHRLRPMCDLLLRVLWTIRRKLRSGDSFEH